MEASIGRIVHVRTPQQFNASNIHPGIITNVWRNDADGTAYVNLKVLPDCGAPYDETSITVYPDQAAGEAGVSPTRFAFWPPRV